jgi:hypothetical protein
MIQVAYLSLVSNAFLLDGCIASVVIELDAKCIKELQMKINKQSKNQ